MGELQWRISRWFGVLIGLVTFVVSWIYCIYTYGYLFGVGLGWLPSLIVALLAYVIATLLGAAIVWVAPSLLLILFLAWLTTLKSTWVWLGQPKVLTLALLAPIVIAVCWYIGEGLADSDRLSRRSKISEGFNRIGIVTGSILALSFLLAGTFGMFGPAKTFFDWLVICLIPIVVFYIVCGFFRLLGWIINGFVSGDIRSLFLRLKRK